MDAGEATGGSTCDGDVVARAMLDGGLQGLQIGVKVTPYVACLVDPSPGHRAVHCPTLPAVCPTDPCQPVHFSYAIPVRVQPLDYGLAELVLELPTDQQLSPRAAAFLLAHHPQLRPRGSHQPGPQGEMAATAKAPVRCEPEEDIAAIAKQISDHAEAIYQTWKSRGLAPADILTCHNSETAADRFGSALTPQPRSPPIELLAQAPTMDNNRLERLVSNFVTEDKARLAAAKGRSPINTISNSSSTTNKNMPSSIQYALQKFEKNNVGEKLQQQPNQLSPKIQQQSSQLGPKIQQQQQQQQPNQIGPKIQQQTHQFSPKVQQQTHQYSPKIQPQIVQPSTKIQHQPQQVVEPMKKPQIGPKPRFPQADTIEFTLPADITPTNVNSWPLKNRLVGTDTVKQRTIAEKTATLDEVALEEKRLINALKNGVVLSDERTKLVAPSEPNSTRWGPRAVRRPEQQVPHPELTTTQRQHLRQVQTASPNPVRPFLTRGSVAERVLIFERCPSELLLDKRIRAPTAPKLQVRIFFY